ncbi:MAG: porin family protein [Bacteroidales bacterium]|jgi:hypothetical protein
MKIYLKFALAILLMVSFTDVQAQIKPGYIFGLNLSTITLKTKGISSRPETPAGIHFGGFLEIPVIGNFTLQPGLLLSAKGSNFKIDSTEFSLAPVYLEIPVIAVYSFGSDVVKVSLFAGPYFACGIGGYKIESEGAFRYLSFGSGENKDLKPFDFGLNFGAGVNIKGFMISAQYGIGLLNILPSTTTDSEIKNKVIGISISSLFAIK